MARWVGARDDGELGDGDVELAGAAAGDVEEHVHALGAGRRRAGPRPEQDGEGHRQGERGRDEAAGGHPASPARDR